MRRLAVMVATPAVMVVGGVVAWRHNPRMGTRVMNKVVNPLLVRRGFSGGGRSELGTIEHLGRRSRTRYLTPVHPEPCGDGFRIMVPVGRKSEWARNVLAAGHCRMQLHGAVYELDEPSLMPARDVAELSTGTRWLSDRLGFMYLRLHRYAEHRGTFESIEREPSTAREPEPAPGAVPQATMSGAGLS